MRNTTDARTTRLLFALILAFALALGAAFVPSPLGEAGVAWALGNEAREVEEPGVAAGAWALTDLQSGEFPGREDASARLPMASTTKIMAALVTLKGGNLDEEVIVSRRTAAFATPAHSNVGLVVGDSLSVRELLMATLISSGDDAAYVLAEHFGGGGEAGVEAFVEELNREAERLGLNDTRFENPVGFDARGHHTSARSGAYDTPRDAILRVPRDGRDGVREHLHAL